MTDSARQDNSIHGILERGLLTNTEAAASETARIVLRVHTPVDVKLILDHSTMDSIAERRRRHDREQTRPHTSAHRRS